MRQEGRGLEKSKKVRYGWVFLRGTPVLPLLNVQTLKRERKDSGMRVWRKPASSLSPRRKEVSKCSVPIQGDHPKVEWGSTDLDKSRTPVTTKWAGGRVRQGGVQQPALDSQGLGAPKSQPDLGALPELKWGPRLLGILGHRPGQEDRLAVTLGCQGRKPSPKTKQDNAMQ